MTDSRYQRMRQWVRAHWRMLKRVLAVAFAALVLTLLVLAVIEVDWHAVLRSLRSLSLKALLLAAGITAASYALYSSFDLLGRRYTGHSLAWWRAVLVGFVAYAFTMSMGTPVGGLGMRVRLYSKQGLKQGVIMRVLATTLMTNWTGYIWIAGIVLLSGNVSLPDGWDMGNTALRAMGVVGLLVGVTYLVASAFSRTRAWTVWGHTIELPSFRLAILQCVLGSLNWALIAGVLFVLFQGAVPYFEVLAILLISAIAGALAHVPGGIGVIEYVFVAMLAPDIPRSDVLAVVLVYRLYYYLVPLGLAGLTYLLAEAALKPAPRHA